MELVFEFVPIQGLIIVLAVILGIVRYSKHAFQYWNKRNVPYHRTPKLIFGDLSYSSIFNVHIAEYIKQGYFIAKAQQLKHTGGYVFLTPKYMPIHPEYVKNILERGFNYFIERGFYYNEKDDPLSANLFALGGAKWKLLRTKLSPAFTALKLKQLFEEIFRCAEQMREAIKPIDTKQETTNIKDVAECFTIDVIGSCAFGLECNSLKNKNAEFKKQGEKVFHFTILRTIKTVIAFAFPNFSRKVGITLFDKELNRFFLNVVSETLHYRKTNNVDRRDFLQLLHESKSGLEVSENNTQLTIEELTAQVFIFFAAGFETSSLTLAYCLYELAINVEIQNKVRNEINQVLAQHEEKLTYDAVMDMKYMNQVVEETLRKYPPVPFITRKCVKDYQMPGTNSRIEKGIDVVISILGIHHDPEYYPNPNVFDPERFSEENKRNRHPFTFIPFGEGPRICIGLRFGLLQTKVALVNLLKHYTFTLNQKTDVPLKINPMSFTLMPKSEIILNVREVNNF